MPVRNDGRLFFGPQGGVGLIEVLVAVFILAIGVLGAAALQMNALKFNQNASVRTQATFLAYEIVDRMRANRAQALVGAYEIALDEDAPACGAALPGCDLRDWRDALANRLPEGTGAVVRNGNNFTITVEWSEARLGLEDNLDTGDSDESLGRFVFVTQL